MIEYKRKEKDATEEFTEEMAEFMLYQFRRYISSCSCYLMDKRLKQKRRLYSGLDDGFVITEKQELVLKRNRK